MTYPSNTDSENGTEAPNVFSPEIRILKRISMVGTGRHILQMAYPVTAVDRLGGKWSFHKGRVIGEG